MLKAGEVFLLSAQRSFVLAGDLPASSVDATSLFTGNGDRLEVGGQAAERNRGYHRRNTASSLLKHLCSGLQ